MCLDLIQVQLKLRQELRQATTSRDMSTNVKQATTSRDMITNVGQATTSNDVNTKSETSNHIE